MLRERSRRVPASQAAVLTILPERTLKLICRVADFSSMGIGLNCDAEIPVRAEVLLEMDGCIVSGEVCYCREWGREYRVGLQLDQALQVPEDPSGPVKRILKIASA